MKNNIEVCILFKNRSSVVIYCCTCTFNINTHCFTIQFYDSRGDYDEMYVYLDDVLSFEVYYV